MRETEVAVTFRPSGKTVYVLRQTRLMEAAAGTDIVVDQPCGGAGLCGKCRVKVSGEVAAPTSAEDNIFSDAELAAGWRLACQSTVAGPTTVTVDQRRVPDIDGHFTSLGTFDLDQESTVVVRNDATDGYVVVDALQLMPCGNAKTDLRNGYVTVT